MNTYTKTYSTIEEVSIPDDISEEIKIPHHPTDVNNAIINIPYMVGRFSITHDSTLLRLLHYITFPMMKIGLITGILCIPLAIGLSNDIKILEAVSYVFVVCMVLFTGILYYKNINNIYVASGMLIYDIIMIGTSIGITIALSSSPGDKGAYIWLYTPMTGALIFGGGGFLQFVIFHKVIDGEFPAKIGPDFIPKWLDDIIRLWFGTLFITMTFIYDKGYSTTRDIGLYNWAQQEYKLT